MIRSFEELSRRISSSVSDVLVRVSYLYVPKFVVSVCSREGLFSKENLETGIGETIVGRNGFCHV